MLEKRHSGSLTPFEAADSGNSRPLLGVRATGCITFFSESGVGLPAGPPPRFAGPATERKDLAFDAGLGDMPGPAAGMGGRYRPSPDARQLCNDRAIASLFAIVFILTRE